MSNKVDEPNDAQVAKRSEELLFDVESLSQEQLETGVRVAENFTDDHLASQTRKNQASEGSTVSLAKRHFTWALCLSAIGILIVCAAMLAYLIVNVGIHLSKTPEQASSVLWSIVTRKNLD